LEIRRPWDEAIHGVESSEKYMLSAFQNVLAEKNNVILEAERTISSQLADIFERFRRARENLKSSLVKIKMTIDQNNNYLSNAGKKLLLNYTRLFSNFVSLIKSLAEKITLHNPERQLKLGYSLVSLNNKIVRSVEYVKIGDEVDVKMSDGELKSKIISKKL
jgi:exodeoxyribonuclease VII large subunit